MTTRTSIRPGRLAALACGALLLTACGGGGGDDAAIAPTTTAGTAQVPGTAVPTAATTSVGSLIDFMRSLIAGTSESGEPIALGNAVLATSETDEPVARP